MSLSEFLSFAEQKKSELQSALEVRLYYYNVQCRKVYNMYVTGFLLPDCQGALGVRATSALDINIDVPFKYRIAGNIGGN